MSATDTGCGSGEWPQPTLVAAAVHPGHPASDSVWLVHVACSGDRASVRLGVMGEDGVERLLERLRAAGERVTTARRAVLEEMLVDDAMHLSADQIAERVNTRHPDVHLSTVYRTLEVLEHVGLVAQVRVGEGAASFHLADHGHHHAMCTRCGTLTDLTDHDLDGLVESIDRAHGFLARPRHLIVEGLCRKCRDRVESDLPDRF